MKKFWSSVFLFLLSGLLWTYEAVAQCAMCKATVENNVSMGESGVAENLNAGILYLFFTPYIAIAIIGYLWYKSSKAHAAKNQRKSYYRG